MANRQIFWYPAGTDFDAVPLSLVNGPTELVQATAGISGFEMPEFDLLEDTSPGVDGASFREAVIKPRNPIVPIFVQAGSREEFRDVKKQLLADFDPSNGPGMLEAQEAIGTSWGERRFLRATYAGGLEGNEGLQIFGTDWWICDIRFRAHDPHWYGSIPSVAQWVGQAPRPFYPILPLGLSRSDVLVSVPLVIRTDMPAWPTWEFKGPFTRVKVANSRTGKWFAVDRVTTGSETIRLVTEPGKFSMRETSQDLRVFPLDDASQLFPLVNADADPGVLVVTVHNGDVSTVATVTTVPRFRSAP